MIPWHRLVETMFRTTPEGRVLRPHGLLGPGYIVDEASERLVRAWHARAAPLVTALAVFAVLALSLLPLPWSLVLALLPIAGLDLAWRRFIARLRPGWRRSVTPAKPAEAVAAVARAMPLWWLAVAAAGSALLTLVGMVAAILSWDAPEGRRWTALGATALFGACTALNIFLLRLRRG